MSDDKILDRIRAFLAKANDENNHEAERELARVQANKLMARHAIDQALLDMTRAESERRRVINEQFKLYDDENLEYIDRLLTVMQMLCGANRVKMAAYPGLKSVHLVGVQEDVDWVKMLWLQILLEFVSRIRPTWDRSKPVVDNIYNFKNAGYKWKDIWDEGYRQLGEMPDGQQFFKANKCAYMISGYKRLCRERGTNPVATQRFEAYRHSFAEAFRATVCARIEALNSATEEASGEIVGSAVALRDVQSRVDEEFYRLFPYMRPTTMTAEEREAYYRQIEEEQAERARKDAEYLAGLSAADRKRVLHDREARERRQARENDRYWREQARKQEKLADVAGYAAGQAAGKAVNVKRGARAASDGPQAEALEG